MTVAAEKLLAASLLAIVLGSLPLGAQTTAPSGGAVQDPATFVKRWDRSNKGLLDIKAILNAAIVKFELLDKNHEGRLNVDEFASVLTPQEFALANPDGDKTIGAVEWFDLVRRQFDAANPDNDGTLSIDELKTPAGQRLLKLLQ